MLSIKVACKLIIILGFSIFFDFLVTYVVIQLFESLMEIRCAQILLDNCLSVHFLKESLERATRNVHPLSSPFRLK